MNREQREEQLRILIKRESERTALSISNFMLYIVFIMSGVSAVTSGEWSIIEPGGQVRVTTPSKVLISKEEISFLMPFRIFYLVIMPIAKLLGLVVGSVLAIALAIAVYVICFAWPLTVLLEAIVTHGKSLN